MFHLFQNPKHSSNPNSNINKMSDYIPFEIQSEIIKRPTVKSVIRCRSVSKRWKSLIDSSKFIASYHISNTHHLFVRYYSANNEYKHVSIVDDDTFPNHKSSLTVPHSVSLLMPLFSLNGLLCFYGLLQDYKKMVVLWNPSIQKSVDITISDHLVPYGVNSVTRIGFGVCSNTSDPKLVRINITGLSIVENWEVEVFTLSTRVWKSVSNIPPSFRTCDLRHDHVFVDGFIFWQAYKVLKWIHGSLSSLIISFDLKSNEFGEVCLPSRLVRINDFTISKVYESLGLFEFYKDAETMFCDVWIMKEGVTKAFTKMLSIKAPDTWVDCRVLELRKNGEVIIENADHANTIRSALEVYEHSSGRSSGLGFNGICLTSCVNSYMETLLLLDESLSIIN